MTELNKYSPTQMPLFFDDFITRDAYLKSQKALPFNLAVYPSTNITETEIGIEIQLIVPGINPDDIEVGMSNNALEVNYEASKPRFFSGKRQIWAAEHRPKSFHRRYELNPEMVNYENIEATFENGILTIRIEKSEAYIGKMIPAHSFSDN